MPTPTSPSRLALWLDLIRWNRPAGSYLLLWPTLSALWLAAGGFPGWHLLIVFTLGTVLMRSAGCCVNDVADRDFDRHVKRTAERPVTRGAVSVREALTLAAGRLGYAHVVRGSVSVNGRVLQAGDALRYRDEPLVSIDKGQDAEVLVFDLAR